VSFRIRRATTDDVPALANLHVQAFNETHRGGRSGGPSYELRERQWREAFTVTDGSWFCSSTMTMVSSSRSRRALLTMGAWLCRGAEQDLRAHTCSSSRRRSTHALHGTTVRKRRRVIRGEARRGMPWTDAGRRT
jgi:hypothetical protein